MFTIDLETHDGKTSKTSFLDIYKLSLLLAENRELVLAKENENFALLCLFQNNEGIHIDGDIFINISLDFITTNKN